jgi:hypothetical protein
MYHLKMEKPMSNTKSARMPTLPELFNDNKSLPLLLQVQVNNRLTSNKLTTTSGNKHLQHLRLLSSNVMMIDLVPTAYVQETTLRTLNAMALKSTTRRKPTSEPLFAALNHLEDSPAVRRLQANVRVAAAQIEERGPRYSRSAGSS